MKIYSKNIKVISGAFMLLGMTSMIGSCNKALPDALPIVYPPVNSSTTSIGTLINTDTTYSYYKAAATKVGMLAQLSDSTKLFTVFLPNNAAFRASGIPSVAVVNSLPPTSLGGIVGYSIIPGNQYTSDIIPTSFPNIQLPSSLTIGVLPGTTLALKLSTFPSKRANGFWDNNIPVLMPDIKMQNGVIHLVAGIVAPPSQVLKDAIYGDPTLSYFKAAVARADSGSTGLNKIDSLLGYAVTNMTVLVPNDAAFQTLIFGLVYQTYLAAVPLPHSSIDSATAGAMANGAVAAGPAFLSTNNVSTALVKGIIAYHLLATVNPVNSKYEPNIRAFSVNFASTPTFYTTLVNSGVSVHPGVNIQATLTGPFVTSLQFTGYGINPATGQAYPTTPIPAKAVSMDHHAVNGVYHVIDEVLLPQ
jgi:uncharacterized surface protein with fasciclin (FAS1) repeats